MPRVGQSHALSSVALRSPEYLHDPIARLGEVRERCPVAWLDAEETWLVTSYEDVYTALHDASTFSNEAYGRQSVVPLLVLGQDPPIHTKYRRLLNPWLSPGAVDRLRGKLEAYSLDLLGKLQERGAGDLVLDYGNPFPARAVLELCGLPSDDWARYAEPNHAIQYAEPGSDELEHAVAGMIWQAGEIRRIAHERRADPRDDLISALATAEVDGEPIPLDDVAGIMMTVIGGGVDTTTSLYANSMLYLHRDHDVRARLIDDPDLVPLACEEFLRHFTPAQILSREVHRDVELGGETLRANERVGVAIVAANHDEHEFPDPLAVVIDRSPNRHASFGLGIHRCVGSSVARAMIQQMIGDTLRMLPGLVIDESSARSYGSPIVNGWVTLPSTFGATAR